MAFCCRPPPPGGLTGRAVSNVLFFLAKANLVEHLERMMNCAFECGPSSEISQQERKHRKNKEKDKSRNKIIGLATASSMLIRGLTTALRGDELAGRCARSFLVLPSADHIHLLARSTLGIHNKHVRGRGWHDLRW